MSEKIAIITDSCADIPEPIRKEYGIRTIPVIVSCGGKEYQDGVTMTASEMYARLRAGETPKTSLPSSDALVRLLRGLHEEGYSHAVVVSMSSSISGTYQMFHRVCVEFREMPCLAVDSGMAAIAEGALAVQLADEVRNGLTWKELPNRVQRIKDATHPFFGLDTLKYLMRGGRIGKARAIAGEVLNIKPILSFDEDGVIDSVEKTRGRKATINRIAERIIHLSEGCRRYRLYFADSEAEADRLMLEEKILSVCKEPISIVRSQLGCALAVHLGPGLIGAAIQMLDD